MKGEIVYSQSKGVVWFRPLGEDQNTSRLGKGYSGHPPYVNDAEAEALKARGPIPRGSYRIGRSFDHVRLGPLSMYLDPLKGTEQFGRSGFFIHGDNSYGNYSASHGCIILGRSIRAKIADSGATVLQVVD